MNEIKKQACFLVFILLIALTGCGRSDDITMEVRLYKCILEDDPVSTYAWLK